MLIDGAQVESAVTDFLMAGRSGNNEMRESMSGLLNILFLQKRRNSQLIRVAFTLRRRCEDTRGQLFDGKRTLVAPIGVLSV